MAAVALAGGWGTRLSALSDARLHPRRRNSSTSSISCSNGPQRAERYSNDWDAAWEKLKEKRTEIEGVSGAEVTKAEHPISEFEPDGRDVGPRLTTWGGNVRGGKYRLGEGADRMLEIWGNGDAALYAAMAVIVLIFVLLQFPPPSAPS